MLNGRDASLEAESDGGEADGEDDDEDDDSDVGGGTAAKRRGKRLQMPPLPAIGIRVRPFAELHLKPILPGPKPEQLVAVGSHCP